MAIHLSDLGIINNHDFAIEILEAFNVEISKVTHSERAPKTVNKDVTNTDRIKKQLVRLNESLNSEHINKSSHTKMDTLDYKNYLIKAKQKKQL